MAIERDWNASCRAIHYTCKSSITRLDVSPNLISILRAASFLRRFSSVKTGPRLLGEEKQ